ncbi:MAG: hypothetical protein QOG54_2721 [Actinomycetota bacterium]|nr:hypothetical protein [Actinomycetota bacterium]
MTNGVGGGREADRVRSTLKLVGLSIVLLMTSVPRPAPAASTGSISEWKPGCYIDGRPLDIDVWCTTGAFSGRFDGVLNHAFFDNPPGAYLNVAIYDSSEAGYTMWGHNGDSNTPFELVSAHVRGTGVPEDPYEQRNVMTFGGPSQMRLMSYTSYVNGQQSFEKRWELQNVSQQPVNFRFIVYGDVGLDGDCAYGDLRQNPLSIGSFTPQEGVPEDPTYCTSPDDDRGYSGYAIQQPESPWSRYQQGNTEEVRQGVGDVMGQGFDNTYEPGSGPEALGVQWDDYGLGRSPLEPGQTASFSMRWRFTSDLVATPYYEEDRDDVHRVTLSTRLGAAGPAPGVTIAYEIYRDLGNNGVVRGTVTTNAKGVAELTWRKKNVGIDEFRIGIDSNADGRIQEATELYRWGMNVEWGHMLEYFRTSVTIERFPGGFGGVLRSRVDAQHGIDCQVVRTVALRRREPGRDVTLGSAVTNAKGKWDLDVDAPSGDYYAFAPTEWRIQDGSGGSYVCKGARSG